MYPKKKSSLEVKSSTLSLCTFFSLYVYKKNGNTGNWGTKPGKWRQDAKNLFPNFEVAGNRTVKNGEQAREKQMKRVHKWRYNAKKKLSPTVPCLGNKINFGEQRVYHTGFCLLQI